MDAQDKKFREIMEAYRPEKAPVDFTRLVMTEVHRQPVKSIKYEPVLGKWFLPLLGVLLGFFVVYAAFFSPSVDGGTYSKWMSSFFSNVPKGDLSGVSAVAGYLSQLLGEVPFVVVFVMLAATMLLVLDRLFQRRHKVV